jgi:hypothetical protein
MMMGEPALKTEIFCASADDAPALPGAYVLAVELKRPLTLAVPRKPATSLSGPHAASLPRLGDSLP